MSTPPPQPPSSAHTSWPSPGPAKAGVGLRHPHMSDFASGQPDITWVEIHSENFFAPGGPRIAQLEAVRRHYDLSCHGVGLSLGSADGLDNDHLSRLRQLVDRFEPVLVSEHLSFSVIDGVYVNDLLPLPYTIEALNTTSENVDAAQNALGRPILIENPSSYLTFVDSEMTEWEFLAALVERTGCSLLLDINNIYVSAANNGLESSAYLEGIPADAVQEIHLAGHLIDGEGEEQLLIDTHGDVVAGSVWTLYQDALAKLGPRPTLIEWDTDIPALEVLLGEAKLAQSFLDDVSTTRGSSRVA